MNLTYSKPLSYAILGQYIGAVSVIRAVVYPLVRKVSARVTSSGSRCCHPLHIRVYLPVKRAVLTGSVGIPSA